MAFAGVKLQNRTAQDIFKPYVSNPFGGGVTVGDAVLIVDEENPLFHGSEDCFEERQFHDPGSTIKLTWNPSRNKRTLHRALGRFRRLSKQNKARNSYRRKGVVPKKCLDYFFRLQY
jgi:hypothetical protein